MKLTYSQVESHLSKKLFPFYLISGIDALLKHDTLRLIRKAAKNAGFHERIKFTAETGTDWTQLYTLLHSASLFTEKRFIELDFRDTTPNKTASHILEAATAQPIENTLLLISMGKIDDKVTKSVWYHEIEQKGATIPIWPITQEQFPQWIKQRAAKYRLTFTEEACHLLAAEMEGNLMAAAQTIEKIYLLKPKAPIDTDLIQTVLTNESRFTLFEFIEHFIIGDKKRALSILQYLQEEGVEPTLILWGITRELRVVAELIQELKNGSTLESLFKKHRIFGQRQRALRKASHQLSVEACWRHLNQAMLIDQQIKGALPGHAWASLQLFCFRMV
jgi:DNA polymerase-3 subunit delta